MRSAILCVVLIASACAPSMRKTGRYPGADDGREMPTGVSARSRVKETTSKVVTGKQMPTTLIAADRATCEVNVPKFNETNVGDRVVCDWYKP
jgi:hypothetical protein